MSDLGESDNSGTNILARTDATIDLQRESFSPSKDTLVELFSPTTQTLKTVDNIDLCNNKIIESIDPGLLPDKETLCEVGSNQTSSTTSVTFEGTSDKQPNNTARRVRRPPSQRHLKCVSCHAFDFPSYSAFLSHHLLHAYASFPLVSIERISSHVLLSHGMVSDQVENEEKKKPIKLTIRLSSLKEKNCVLNDNDRDQSETKEDSSCFDSSEQTAVIEQDNSGDSGKDPALSDSEINSDVNLNSAMDSSIDIVSDPKNCDIISSKDSTKDLEVTPVPATSCLPCSVNFFSTCDLEKHINLYHKDQQKCFRCDSVFEDAENLIIHVRTNHADDLNLQPDPSPVPPSPVKPEIVEEKQPKQQIRVVPPSQLMSPSLNENAASKSPEGPCNQTMVQIPMENANFCFRESGGPKDIVGALNNDDSGFSHTFVGDRSITEQPKPQISQQFPFSILPNLATSSGLHPSIVQPYSQHYVPPQSHAQSPRMPLLNTTQRPRPSTPIQGRGRPLSAMPKLRIPLRRPSMNSNSLPSRGFHQGTSAGFTQAKKRPSVSPRTLQEKRAKQDSDDIEILAVKKIASPQLAPPENTSFPKLPSSISISVKTLPAPSPNSENRESGGIASVLANRGVTVSATSPDSSSHESPVPRIPPKPSLHPSAIPSGNSPLVSQPQRNNFVIPSPPIARNVSEKDRPPRPPTVDLTGDQNKYLFCQACKKRFPDKQRLRKHLEIHISQSLVSQGVGPKGAFVCSVCNNHFKTVAALEAHKQLSHTLSDSRMESFAIPIVDLSDSSVTSRLSGLGIKSCLPVGKLTQLGNGTYGIPLVSIDSKTGGSNFPFSSAILTLGAIQKLP
ncbi:uncharacterized protein LOC136037748 isoform X2 [Artemia franciscana]|uniref:uncharacterized protein LOC136037748 isoform X2 n=1 Tax=Artemia franciscana TaxID=6661 RepID=UPI0032DA88D9